jgi:hypothetical protein
MPAVQRPNNYTTPTAEHVVAVLEKPTGEEASLRIARDSVLRGGSATVVVLMTSQLRRTIREMARQQQISTVEAEQFYLDRVREAIRNSVGGEVVIVIRRSTRVQHVLATAFEARATALAIPTSMAGRRGWGRALATSPIPVTFTPALAA